MGIIVAAVALTIGAGIYDQSITVVKSIVTVPSADFNTTTGAAGDMMSTAGQFGTIVVVALFGGLALYVLLQALGGASQMAR